MFEYSFRIRGSENKMSPPVKDRLIASGAELIAEKGFDGVSVREVCKHAKTSINMVHHYFGNKEGLLKEILGQYNHRVFATPMRLLGTAPKSKEDFVSRLEMLFETTLESVIEQRLVMMVALREQADLEALIDYQQKLVTFLEQAKLAGFVRTELDSEMITGAMIDRIINQVQFTPWIKRNSGVDVLTDKEYQKRWCQSNISLFLYGFMQP